MNVRYVLACLALAAGALVSGAAPVEAHAQPYDSTPGREHDLCVWFRPYGVGDIVYHFRIDGYHRRCGVCSGVDRRDLYDFGIRYWFEWTGPHDVTLITNNSSACS